MHPYCIIRYMYSLVVLLRVLASTSYPGSTTCTFVGEKGVVHLIVFSLAASELRICDVR